MSVLLLFGIFVAITSFEYVSESNMAAYAQSTPGVDVDGLLSVTFIDLKTKGDSTLIVLPNESVILIDGGMPSAYPNIKKVLDDFKIDTIDVLVATHADQDHIAGLNSLLQNSQFTIKQVLTSPISKDTKTYQKFLQHTAYNRINAYAGYDIALDDSVNIQIISPPEGYRLSKATNAGLENTNSLVTLLEYGDIEFLFTGDATYVTENWLINNVHGDDLDVDILNAPHHGSKHSSTVGFIDATSPELVIYSANVENQYGHPHADTINRYKSQGITGLHTGMVGHVLIQTDGTGCSLMLQGMLESPCFEDVISVSESIALALSHEESSSSTTAPPSANESTPPKVLNDDTMDNDESELLTYVENIRTLLDDARAEYANGNIDLALDYVNKAYLDNYEFLETPLVDAGEHELAEEIEVMIREELLEMMSNEAHHKVISAQIDAILIKMDTVETIVPEFGTALAMILFAVAIIAVMFATRINRKINTMSYAKNM